MEVGVLADSVIGVNMGLAREVESGREVRSLVAPGAGALEKYDSIVDCCLTGVMWDVALSVLQEESMARGDGRESGVTSSTYGKKSEISC
jgi:hypothetical protein